MKQRVTGIPLKDALRTMLRNPSCLLRDWNWKAAAFSAMMRGTLFFLVNRYAGRASAVKAMLVEMVYATAVAGLAGAITQRLRHAMPRIATAAVVMLAVPLAMLAGQAVLHHSMRTPRLRSGLLLSFLFASLANGFTWFAMSRNVFVTGSSQGFFQDLARLPKLLLQIFSKPGLAGSPGTVLESAQLTHGRRANKTLRRKG